MISLGASKKVCSPKQAAQLSRAVTPLLYRAHTVGLGYPAAIRVAAISHQLSSSPATRGFSTTSANHLRDIFPAKETAYIRQTPPAWPHPGYTEEEMLAVTPAHRPPRTVGDWLAWKLVRLARYVIRCSKPRFVEHTWTDNATDGRRILPPGLGVINRST
jgi:hypothetical protein